MNLVLSFQQLANYAPTLSDYAVISDDEHGFLVATGTDPQTGQKVKLFQGTSGAVVVPDIDRPNLDQISNWISPALVDATRAFFCADGQQRTQIKTQLNAIRRDIDACKEAVSALSYSAAMAARHARIKQNKPKKTAKIQAP